MAADTSRSGGSADSYIGSLISLTSKYEIRYEGVLYNINTEESSIGLRNVRSFGTEGRKKDGPQVPPSDKVYEYILFRGSDIKDLQVKSSPPVQTTQPIHNDPAIIQSHYSRPAPVSTSVPPASSGPVADLTSQTPQMGLPRPPFQGGLPLYQPGGSLGSWGTSPPPSANGSGLAVPMYWQGFYGPSGGLPHMQQQSLLRPPPGLSVPPNMHMQPPMQYPGMNPSLTTLASNFPPSSFSASNLPPSSLPASNLPPSNFSASNLPPSSMPALNLPSSSFSASNLPPSSLPASNLPPSSFSASNLPPSSSSVSNLSPSNLPEFPNTLLPPGSSGALNLTSSTLTSPLTSTLAPTHSAAIASEPSPVWIPNKAPTAVIPTTTPSGSLPLVSPLTTSSMDYAIVPPMSNKPKTVTGPSLPYQSMPQSISSVVGTSSSSHSEASVPSLVTPGQLLQPGSSKLSSSQSSQPAHEGVEVVQAPATSERPPSPSKEHQAPLLPLPSPPDQKLNGASLHTRNNYGGYRGRERGRGNGILRPVTKFTEDFDFMAMNEKFKKDEVWGHLGKNNVDKVGDGEENDEEYSHDEDDVGSSKIESKPVYVKDDFFDSLSCNSLDRGSYNGRTKFSEQMKIDTETFGDFPRHRGGRGGRGPFRGGRSRGHYGRGYGYVGRGGRGQTMSNRGNYN